MAGRFRFDFEGSKLVMVIVFAMSLLVMFSQVVDTSGDSWKDWKFQTFDKSNAVTIYKFLLLGGAVLIAFSLISKKSAGRKDILMLGLAVLVLWYVWEKVLPQMAVALPPLENIASGIMSAVGFL